MAPGERWNPMQFLKLHRCRRLSTESHSDSSHHVVQWLLVQQWQSKRCRLVRGDEQHRPFPSAPVRIRLLFQQRCSLGLPRPLAALVLVRLGFVQDVRPHWKGPALSRSKQVEPFDCPNLHWSLDRCRNHCSRIQLHFLRRNCCHQHQSHWTTFHCEWRSHRVRPAYDSIVSPSVQWSEPHQTYLEHHQKAFHQHGHRRWAWFHLRHACGSCTPSHWRPWTNSLLDR